MGCAASSSARSVEKEERLRICRDRRRAVKQLLLLSRTQFAAALISYLHSLKNTGAALRQFTESDSPLLDLHCLLPPLHHPDLDLPSPPPPLPAFTDDDEDDHASDGDSIVGDALPPPPPLPPWEEEEEDHPSPSSSSSSPDELQHHHHYSHTTTSDIVLNPISISKAKALQLDLDLGEIANTTLDLGTNTTTTNNNKTLLPPNISSSPTNKNKKKSLSDIIKEIDDYFLKASASASGRDVILLLDVAKATDNHSPTTTKPSKVFTAFSWNWSSKSLLSPKGDTAAALHCYQPDHNDDDPCKPGAHALTLQRIRTQEDKLYKHIKEEEHTKLEYERKTSLLQKYETGDQDMLRTEEIRSSIEALQDDICTFQQLISDTNSTILKLIEDELHPQLIMLSSGLMHMWKTMHDCHEVQMHTAQQMNYLTNHSSIRATTDYHRQSTVQLETEVTGLYISFCNLLKSQHEYVQVLNRWVQLTDCLVDGEHMRNSLSIVQHLCEHWELGMDNLPEKVAAEALKSFLSVIHSIVMQQAEEHLLQKKSVRLEEKLQREIQILDEMEMKFGSNITGDGVTNLSPSHPLAVKRAKTEAFRKRVEDEKNKYTESIKHSNSMTLNNLQKSLPNVFQALSTFSSVSARVFEAVISHPSATVSEIS